MKVEDLYRIKVESYRDFRTHLLGCFNAYLLCIGLLGYFAFEAHAKPNIEQFRILWCILMGVLTVGLFLSRYYVDHAKKTAADVEKLSSALELEDKPEIPVRTFGEDGEGMRAAMWAFAILNGFAWVVSLLIFWHYAL